MKIFIFTLTNKIQTKSNQRVETSFFLNNSQDIIRNTSHYELAITRFSLNTQSLPIFIPQMKDDNSMDAIYSCTMEYNGYIFQQYMPFIPQNISPIEAEEKYYVYNYQYVVYLFNNMMIECIKGLSELTVCPTGLAPLMYFDINNKIVGIQLDIYNYGYNDNNKINVYFNTHMYSLISTIPASMITQSQGRDFQLNNLICDDPSLLIQEMSTINVWNPISSIVFKSNLLPIYASVTAPIQIYTDGKLSNNNTSYHFQNILTDFIGNDMIFTPFVQYAPSIYRFMSLKSNSQIRNIDLQVYWFKRDAEA